MRAIGIVRVSERAGREGESFVSPGDQRKRIREACEREGFELARFEEEIDVSGGTPLTKRRGLGPAVEAVEAGEAEVVMVAYFDRLVRSLRVQGEVVERVEAAGGRVLALDFGEVSGKTAAQWLSGTMIGAVSEYYRRSAGERNRAAQQLAVARGALPFPSYPPGYVKGDDGVLVPNEDAPAVAEAFALRAKGAPIAEVRDLLASRGVELSYRRVQGLLASRLVLGEIHFGKLVNLAAHPAIVERDVWDAAQRVRVTRGTRPTSDRLLARLGVLVCGTCGGRMVVGTHAERKRVYPFYRCASFKGCTKRMAVGAEIAEGVVVAATQDRLRDLRGRASAESEVRDAEAAAENSQARLDAAIKAFDALGAEPAVLERLRELQAARDADEARLVHLRRLHSVMEIDPVADWDRLSLEGRRGLIRETIARASVGPGRGPSRISIVAVAE